MSYRRRRREDIWPINLSWISYDHNMEQALCALLFFFFCLGGWSTTLMAASKTAFTFCHYNITWIPSITRGEDKWQICQEEKNIICNTCCVFELHSMYAGAPISFFISSPFRQKRKLEIKVIHQLNIYSLSRRSCSLYLSSGDGHCTSMIHKELFIIPKICIWNDNWEHCSSNEDKHHI